MHCICCTSSVSTNKNIFFIGDAFYSFPPSFAQGASQSIEAANDLFSDIKNNTSEVNQFEGLLIFTDSKPVKSYEYLGTVKSNTGGFGGSQYEDVRKRLIKNSKKEIKKIINSYKKYL